VFPEDLGFLAILEYPEDLGFLAILEYLGVLEYPEFPEDPEYLGNYLKFPEVLEYPEDPEYLEYLEIPELLEYPELIILLMESNIFFQYIHQQKTRHIDHLLDMDWQ